MHRKIKTLAILLVLSIWIALGIYKIIDIKRDEYSLTVFEEFLFSTFAYFGKSKIDVTSYVMTSEQVSDLMKNNPEKTPKHRRYSKNYLEEPLYVVIRINSKEGGCYVGTLYCVLPTGEKYLLPVSIFRGKKIQNYVIPIFVKPSFFKNKSTKTKTRWVNFSVT